MGIGGGIALIVVGAIFTFAVPDIISGVDLTMVGYICMVGGVIPLVLTLVMDSQRRRTAPTEQVEREDRRRVG